ncbi:hypothetical protein DAETH_42970 (plasmid) [Deinococcus aetherius]|uniref:Uncharacterized protein n=1 Tax=Deinococcus aetherius TaxID=200252 RepID=A0ABM8AKH7_9DEIO|nr:hypothetical protein DAETH_42970 [Deinococcus aetherius]
MAGTIDPGRPTRCRAGDSDASVTVSNGFRQLDDKQAELPKGQRDAQAAPCTTSLQTRRAALK